MKHLHPTLLPLAGICGVALFCAPMVSSAQNTVFDDTFNAGSTLNSAPSLPTANSTSYQAGSGVAGSSSSIGSGDLHLGLPSSTSALAEFQAIFSGAPISLGTIGDYLDLSITFTGTGILNESAGSTLNIGLFNSGGVAPL